MKCTLVIDKSREEEVRIFAHEKTHVVERIIALAESGEQVLVGKRDKMLYRINQDEVVCFVSEGNKVFAVTDTDRLEIDKRLYELEKAFPDFFVRINQSCLANIKKIKCFDASIMGTLVVNFKNGYRDYVSRRQMKYVKERLMKK